MAKRNEIVPRWNGQVLRRYREARGWSLEELSGYLGARRGLVNKWENSKSAPGGEYLAALTILFGVQATTFVTGVDAFNEHVASYAARRLI